MGNLYEMGLMLRYMQRIKDGRKCIEMRINDEKRKLIVPGDQILFHGTEDERETLLVEVVDIKAYPSFKEVYEAYLKTMLGYMEDEPSDYRDMYAIYPKERIEKNGVLAIRIKPI